MADVEEDEPGIPEWVVTFGDMMSLLLTFFIMLVSMSELKEEEKFQAMLESMRRQFGHEASMASIIPGAHSQANSSLSYIAPTESRANRKNLSKGGNETQSVVGDHTRVKDMRRGRNSTSGGVVYFDEDSAELSESAKADLAIIAKNIAGKPQKVEIRGHTSRRPVDPNQGLRDHWDLGYNRAHNVSEHLISLGIESERIRTSSAGAFEPVSKGLDVEERKRNARVEILMWDERISEIE